MLSYWFIDSFDLVHYHILLMNPLPTLNKIFSIVLQHERQYKVYTIDDSNILINFVDYRKAQGEGRGNGSSLNSRN